MADSPQPSPLSAVNTPNAAAIRGRGTAERILSIGRRGPRRTYVVALVAGLSLFGGCGGNHDSTHTTSATLCKSKYTHERVPCSEADAVPVATSTQPKVYDATYLEDRLPQAFEQNGDGSLGSVDCIRRQGNEYDCVGVLIPESGQGEHRVQVDVTLDPSTGDIHYSAVP
jgi:hypothetical protein